METVYYGCCTLLKEVLNFLTDIIKGRCEEAMYWGSGKIRNEYFREKISGQKLFYFELKAGQFQRVIFIDKKKIVSIVVS